MRTEVPAAAAAIRILERLSLEWPRGVSPGVVASELGINRSTCYNILATLQRYGWAISLGDRAGWSLGPRLLTLTGVPAHVVTQVVQEELDELARRLDHVVFAAEQGPDGGYTVVARAEKGGGVRVTVSLGEVFPFSAPALMQAFCAWMDPAEFERVAARHGVERFTERTVTDMGELRRTMARVREAGYGTSIQEYSLAQSGVAAPVFDRHGRPCLALCTLAFSTELTERNAHEVGRLVKAHADRITERTGGAHPPSPAEPAEPVT